MFAVVITLLALGTIYVIFNDNTSLFATESQSGDRMKVTDHINSIDLQIDSSSTTIMPTEQNEVKAELDGKGTLRLLKKGDTIEVTVSRKWYEWISFTHKSNVTVYIPKDYHNNMCIDMGAGNLDFSGESKSIKIKLDELVIDMSSGNVELQNIDANVFRHDGSSGRLMIDTLSTRDGKIDISSGNVKLSHYEGPLNGELSSGRLEVGIDTLNGDIVLDLSSGKVELDLPDDADFTLNGETSSGSVSSDFSLKNQKMDSGDLSGVHGSGKYNIDVSVSSGSVRIY